MKIGAVMFFTTDSMRPAALGKALEDRVVSNPSGCRSTRMCRPPG